MPSKTILPNGNDLIDTPDYSLSLTGLVLNEQGEPGFDVRMESDTEQNMFLLDANGETDGAIYLGGNANGLRVIKGGGVRLLGNATVFEDLRIDALSTRVGVVAPTDETGFRGNANFISRNFVHNQADEIQFPVQMPHAWMEGGSLFPHVHFAPWGATLAATDYAVRFILEYYLADVDNQFPTPPLTYAMTKTWNAAGSRQWYHFIAGNATALDMTGKKLSSVLKCRLYRDNTVANNLADKVAMLYVDFHYEVDAIGSNQEYIK